MVKSWLFIVDWINNYVTISWVNFGCIRLKESNETEYDEFMMHQIISLAILIDLRSRIVHPVSYLSVERSSYSTDK